MVTPRSTHSHTAVQKAFIVRRLAAFYSPREIAAAFAAVFPDTACNENDVMATDPRVNVVSPELHALFMTERERVLLDEKSAPYAQQLARLIVLSRQVEDAIARGDPAGARAILRQIAEETGAVGGKAGAAKSSKAVEGEPVTAIEWQIVDPAPVPAKEPVA